MNKAEYIFEKIARSSFADDTIMREVLKYPEAAKDLVNIKDDYNSKFINRHPVGAPILTGLVGAWLGNNLGGIAAGLTKSHGLGAAINLGGLLAGAGIPIVLNQGDRKKLRDNIIKIREKGNNHE